MKKKETKKVSKKVDTKNESKKVDKIKASSNSEWSKIIKTAIWVLVIFVFFYGLTYVIVGDFSFGSEEEETEVAIQYDEIIAGASFNMNTEKYLVVYYDSTSDEANEIENAIYTYEYSNSDPLRVYTVDLANALNTYAIADESNKTPTNAGELAINGPTLIRFRDGNVREYIEGLDNVVDYLS